MQCNAYVHCRHGDVCYCQTERCWHRQCQLKSHLREFQKVLSQFISAKPNSRSTMKSILLKLRPIYWTLASQFLERNLFTFRQIDWQFIWTFAAAFQNISSQFMSRKRSLSKISDSRRRKKVIALQNIFADFQSKPRNQLNFISTQIKQNQIKLRSAQDQVSSGEDLISPDLVYSNLVQCSPSLV